jgi:hypothetical protein
VHHYPPSFISSPTVISVPCLDFFTQQYSFSINFITFSAFLLTPFLHYYTHITYIRLIFSVFLAPFYPFCSWRLLSPPCLMASDLLAVITQGTISSCTCTLPSEASSFCLLPLNSFCGFELKKSPEFLNTILL